VQPVQRRRPQLGRVVQAALNLIAEVARPAVNKPCWTQRSVNFGSLRADRQGCRPTAENIPLHTRSPSVIYDPVPPKSIWLTRMYVC
jgi:hypothetical protein